MALASSCSNSDAQRREVNKLAEYTDVDVEYLPDADSYIYNGLPNSNFGGATNLFAGDNIYRILLYWDVLNTPIPEGADDVIAADRSQFAGLLPLRPAAVGAVAQVAGARHR